MTKWKLKVNEELVTIKDTKKEISNFLETIFIESFLDELESNAMVLEGFFNSTYNNITVEIIEVDA